MCNRSCYVKAQQGALVAWSGRGLLDGRLDGRNFTVSQPELMLFAGSQACPMGVIIGADWLVLCPITRFSGCHTSLGLVLSILVGCRRLLESIAVVKANSWCITLKIWWINMELGYQRQQLPPSSTDMPACMEAYTDSCFNDLPENGRGGVKRACARAVAEHQGLETHCSSPTRNEESASGGPDSPGHLEQGRALGSFRGSWWHGPIPTRGE